MGGDCIAVFKYDQYLLANKLIIALGKDTSAKSQPKWASAQLRGRVQVRRRAKADEPAHQRIAQRTAIGDSQ